MRLLKTRQRSVVKAVQMVTRQGVEKPTKEQRQQLARVVRRERRSLGSSLRANVASNRKEIRTKRNKWGN